MKNILKYLFIVLGTLGSVESMIAQDVDVKLPTTNIFNRSEFVTIENVMNSQGHSNWRAGALNPKIRSTSGDNFKHTTLPGKFLPSSILQWRLQSMGGKKPTFSIFDSWPNYKWFTSAYQTWYHPSTSSSYKAGGIDFYFKVPQNQMANNAFYAGQYKMEIEQDYGRSGFYVIEFSPESFSTYLSIAEAVQWLLINDSKYYEITSLNQFRSGAPLVINLGPMQIGHTVDFHLYAKSDDKNIKFKSLNGDNRKFDVSVVKLGSNHPKIGTFTLDRNWRNHTSNGNLTVEAGNRTNFELQLSISNEDLRTHFFEAGRYEFEIELDARGINDSKSDNKDVEVTVVVPALSEISISGGSAEVNFTFNTRMHYQEGQTKTIPNQIKLSNNEYYELYVKSATRYFNSNNMQSDVEASVLEIGVAGVSNSVALSTHSQKIIKNGSPVLDKNLDIIYTISPGAAQSLIAKDKKTYGINIIYSFTAL